LHGLQSRKAVSIIKEHQVTVLIFTGRGLSLGYAERAKLELCFYFRRRLEPAPSGWWRRRLEPAPSGGSEATRKYGIPYHLLRIAALLSSPRGRMKGASSQSITSF
jgi:hypothetical protein